MTEDDKRELKAPYISKGWMAAFLGMVKRVRISNIDRKLISDYGITTSGNASKVVSALKFFGIIDDDGSVIEDNYRGLMLVGEPYKNSIKALVERSYHDVLQKVTIEKAHVSDMENYFRNKYGYTDFPARQATILFAYLCREAGISVSEELESLNKNEPYKKGKKESKTKSIDTRSDLASTAITRITNTKEGFYIASLRGPAISIDLELDAEMALDLKKKLDELANKKMFKNPQS